MDTKIRAKLDQRLKKWRDELINLSRTNRLLFFRHTKSASLEIIEPGSEEIVRRLSGPASSNFWEFYIPPPPVDEGKANPPPAPPRRPSELLVRDKNATELNSALRLLERKTVQEFVDRGLWTLYLGLGALEWIDVDDDNKKVQSPLLLVPVSFSRESIHEPFRLHRTEDDAVLNPALAVKLLNDFSIVLPGLEEARELDPAGVRDTVAEAVRDQRGWSVVDRVVLTTFTFHKEAMYRDLLDNEETIADHPLIQILALGPESPSADLFDFEEHDEASLDDVVPPEELVSIRDADSTQRRCVLAARDGRSFVMDGPPGTGKSQTITNLIAEVIAVGKTVLFVSEKAAALEVVHKRLQEARLTEFVLELHSHKATRKAVAAELGQALAVRPSARQRFDSQSSKQLAAARRSLSQYALAMNETRSPLGRSLHDALGRVATMGSLPQAPVPSIITSAMRSEEFNDLLRHAETLGRNWGPVERGERFVWRDLHDTSTSAARQHDLAGRVEHASSALEALRRVTGAIDDELRLRWRESPRDAARLQALLLLIDERPEIPVDWLTASDLAPVRELVAARSATTESHQALTTELSAELDDAWTRLDSAKAGPLAAALDNASVDSPSWQPSPNAELNYLAELLDHLRACREQLQVLESNGKVLAEALGARDHGWSIRRLAELAEIGSLVGSTDAPEPTWLTPVVQAALSQAASVLGELLDDFRKRQASMAAVFTPAVLSLDLQALRARFADVHRGLGKAKRAYREDKRTIAACAVSGKTPKDVLARLDDALAWADLAKRLEGAERQHAALLGDFYYSDREHADFGRITRAIDVAKRTVELAGDELNTTSLQQQIGRGGEPDPSIIAAARRVTSVVTAWRDGLSEAFGTDVCACLEESSLDAVGAWCERMEERIELLADTKTHFDGVVGGVWPLSSIRTLLTKAADAASIASELQGTSEYDRAVLGASYDDIDTNWFTINRAIDWAEAVRDATDGPLRPRVAEAIRTTASRSADLAGPFQQWSKTKEALLSVFADRRSQVLDIDLEVSFDDASVLLGDLGSTLGDIEVWSLHATALDELSEAGLHAVTSFCIDNKVDAGDVASIVERAVLEAWCDSVIKGDHDRLSPSQANERDALVAQFRSLDVALVEDAAARVVNACSARRPTSVAGAAGTIQREAQKQRKHMPIRELLDKAGTVAQQLKPCFMMSPLSVSQYLPSSLKFDVVVFDEASQVQPSDAINCIYRGDQLIVAGDQRQLPPSNFFASMGADDEDIYDEDAIEDFESVLDLCKGAGGLRSLPLLWHYRSQHEALITYSNYRFYDGKLHTFPSAAHDAPDLGVEVIKVDGLYRRGAQRDNPIEAAKVVERVLFHLQNHPELSLGVVTFSSAQEDAVVVELERQTAAHPELAVLMGGDRLRGFFVKNLENVQGDERDVIIFSVGYGPDENGKFTVQMGPLNKAGGWRRLNVAITRARRRVEVVTSVLPRDFPGDVKAAGIRHLCGYLDFGLRGIEALALDLEESAGDAESVFEEEVLRSIASWGYEAVPQVGLAGYRIDIGVRDPRDRGRYLLGVECDGAMYHSSKVARDRDRLRQSVIEGLGWQVHRIWGISWFRDRAGQEVRLRNAIESAVAGEPIARAATVREPVAPEVDHEEIDFDAAPDWTIPYIVATPSAPRHWVEMHEPNARPDLRRMVREVIDVEAPVHEDRVLRVVREAWGVGRAGGRIRAAFDEVITELTKRREAVRDSHGFLRKPDEEFEDIRVPTDDPKTGRTVLRVPPEEIDNAVYWLVDAAHAIGADELRIHVARLFGWGRVGADIAGAIDDATDRMLEQGYLLEHDGLFAIAPKE